MMSHNMAGRLRHMAMLPGGAALPLARCADLCLFLQPVAQGVVDTGLPARAARFEDG